MRQSRRPTIFLSARRRGIQDESKRVDNWHTYQVIKLHSSYALVDARDNLLGDCSGINVLWVKSITQSGDASCDLVELDTLLASIYAERKLTLLEEVEMILLTALIDVHVCCTL